VREVAGNTGCNIPENLVKPKVGDYIVCTYNKKKWIGLTTNYDEQFDDYEIDLLYQSTKYFYFPQIRDKYRISKENIHFILSIPSLKAGTS